MNDDANVAENNCKHNQKHWIIILILQKNEIESF